MTIEERIGLCPHCLNDTDRYCHKKCSLYSKYQGATEQKAIDIEKACEWFAQWLMTWGAFTLREALEKFKKAMEE